MRTQADGAVAPISHDGLHAHQRRELRNLCLLTNPVECDDVLPSAPEGGVSGVVLFPGVDAFWLVDLLRSLVVRSNSFRRSRGTSSWSLMLMSAVFPDDELSS